MAEIVQEVFNDISLEKDPALWQNSQQNEFMTNKRINFLAGFEEALFTSEFDFDKSPSRKNDKLAAALLTKYNVAKTSEQKLKLLGQSMAFGKEDFFDEIHRKRMKVFLSINLKKEALKDLLAIREKSDEECNQCLRLAFDLKYIEDKNLSKEELYDKLNECLTKKQEKFKFNNHSYLKHFSDKVSIKQEAGRGRFLVAGEDISPGELLCQERSYSAVLDRAHVGSHCDQCLVRISSCHVACSNCSLVRYCSQSCQQEALSSHHQYECMIQDTLYRAGCGAWILAYRIVASKSLSFWLAIKDDLKNHDESLGVLGNFEYDSTDIKTVYNLVTHDSAERQPPLLMKESLTSVFFLRCLQSKAYFGNRVVKAGKLSQEELYITRLLHHFMRVVYYNSHEVCMKH